jgi:hypothetical protein
VYDYLLGRNIELDGEDGGPQGIDEPALTDDYSLANFFRERPPPPPSTTVESASNNTT